jgi:hypothetical protein
MRAYMLAERIQHTPAAAYPEVSIGLWLGTRVWTWQLLNTRAVKLLHVALRFN